MLIRTLRPVPRGQSSAFRQEARQIIGQSLNVNVKEDVVLFVGTGCTAAINKVVAILGLKDPSSDTSSKCVVFVGPHEHHAPVALERNRGQSCRGQRNRGRII